MKRKKFGQMKLISTNAVSHYTGLTPKQIGVAEKDGLISPVHRGSGKFINIEELGDLSRVKGKYQS